MSRHKKKKLDPVILEMVNEIGETKWRVFKAGWVAGPISMPSWEREFDTQKEAERCYHDNFGWTTEREYQPSSSDEAPF